MSNRPDWCPADVWDATIADAKERADWLVDAVAASTQNRAFLRGDSEEDNWATESILLNGEKAMRVAMSRAILAERERCSKIAGSELRNTAFLMSNPPQSSAAWDIRNAINAGTPAP